MFNPTLSVSKKNDGALKHGPNQKSKQVRLDDATIATKAEASIWNGHRQNIEYSIDLFDGTEKDVKIEESAKNRPLCRSSSKAAIFQSFRRIPFLKAEEQEKEDKTESVLEQPTEQFCEARVWNGRKEAVEVPLGNDLDVQPTQSHHTAERRLDSTESKTAGSYIFRNKSEKETDPGSKLKLQNDPGFEIIIDDFVAE